MTASPHIDRLTRQFHETYERLAPSFGYETRRESAVPWDQVPEQNRALMIAVVGEVFDALAADLDAAIRHDRRQGELILKWRADAERAEARIAELEAAIRWALGETDFGIDVPSDAPRYWWRKELRARAALAAAPADTETRRKCADCGADEDYLMTDGSWICHKCGAVVFPADTEESGRG